MVALSQWQLGQQFDSAFIAWILYLQESNSNDCHIDIGTNLSIITAGYDRYDLLS